MCYINHNIFLFFSDINECTGERDGCEHFCRNTIGSYYCMCRDGYYLHQDEKTCLGRQCFYLHQDKKPSLDSDNLFKPPSTFFSFYIINKNYYHCMKVSVFEVTLFRIFPHSYWIWKSECGKMRTQICKSTFRIVYLEFD